MPYSAFVGVAAVVMGCAADNDPGPDIGGASLALGGVVTQYHWSDYTPVVDIFYAQATSRHVKEVINFDNDGFQLNQRTPIPRDRYATRGVRINGLQADPVGYTDRLHSPPFAASPLGIEWPHSSEFTFTRPVASFGLFIVSPAISSIEIWFTDGSSEFFFLSAQLGWHVDFHGFVARSNVITRIAINPYDYFYRIDDIQFGVLHNHAPDCSQATPSTSALTVIDQGFHPVTVEGVTDPDFDPVLVTITSIFQDEPVTRPKNESTAPDAQGLGTKTASLRAERDVRGNGRVYNVTFVARDGSGASCSGRITVAVPNERVLVDDGTIYDSTSRY